MFKCHLPAKDGQDKKFGCIFCCQSASSAAGRLPVLFGEKQYLSHILDVHTGEGRWPDESVLIRVGAMVCKSWPENDDWDLLLLDGAGDDSNDAEAGTDSLDSLSRQASTTSGLEAVSEIEAMTPSLPELDREETDRAELSAAPILTPTSSTSSVPVLPSIGYSIRHTANSSSGASLIEEVVEEEDSDWPMQFSFSEERQPQVVESHATIRPQPSSATFDTAQYAFLAGSINAADAITDPMTNMSVNVTEEEETKVVPIVRTTTAYLSLQ